MTKATNESLSPPLFAHRNRTDWGVGVLAWEADGKRGYLFENGVERTMASGFFELMRRVEHPSAEERAASARLQRILAARATARASERLGASFIDQVEKFRETYVGGLRDKEWVEEVRGDGAESRAPRHRDAAIDEANEQLSSRSLDALISEQKHDDLWSLVTSVLGRTDLVPAAHLRMPKSVSAEHRRGLALAVRDLLYGKTPYEQRFERYLAALTAFFGQPARWEIATALSAIVHPKEHVYVQPTVFRQQLKAAASSSTFPMRPTSAAYARLLAIARSVGTQLANHDETPRDLFDVQDFIRIALKPQAKARLVKAKSGRTPRSSDDEIAAIDDE